jgi:hypothetical protein
VVVKHDATGEAPRRAFLYHIAFVAAGRQRVVIAVSRDQHQQIGGRAGPRAIRSEFDRDVGDEVTELCSADAPSSKALRERADCLAVVRPIAGLSSVASVVKQSITVSTSPLSRAQQ